MDSLAAGTGTQEHHRTRRTRFVCVSDTHNTTLKLPKGDVLIHAGDLTNQGSYSELSKAVNWIEKADFEAKIIIAGNHDITLDKAFYAEHGARFHNQIPQDPSSCLSLLTSSPIITYLNHASAKINLTSPSGPRTCFTVFGSPYSPRNGLWAFGYDVPQQDDGPPADLPTLWDEIPLEADIVVTHTPPRTHRDESRFRRAAGCEALRRALWRVRPRLAVCGHVHEARGIERVRWDLRCADTVFREDGIGERWEDPGVGQKQSLVDLSIKGGHPLANDGSRPQAATAADAHAGAGPGFDMSTRGLGGDLTSSRADRLALAGRLGRWETCVVNCAIMAKNYPHVGGKTVNKPIVVDLDLPVRDV